MIIIEKTEETEEDELMEVALEAGMEDFQAYEDSFEIFTEPNDFATVKETLVAAGYRPVEADIENIPTMESEPKDEHDIKTLKKLIEILEDNDDVQKVYHNCSVNFMD